MAETYIASLGYQVDTRPLKRGETALDNLTKAGERTERGIDNVTASVGLLSAGIAVLAANTVITDVINYSDAWTRVDNKLRLVIDSEEQLITKRRELVALSKETKSNLESTASLYAELYRNTRELGTSEEEVMKVTRALNNLFVSGGTDAQTQAGAIRQLSQALAAGALRGDEFNSVAEGAPRILDALAQSLGKGKGELREFAATGGITAEILINAVSSYSSEAQRLADATSKTFQQSVENATTNLTAYVGASQSITDATNALGGAIESATENIDGVVNGVTAAAGVMVVSAIPASVKYTASILSNVQAQLLANTQSARTVNALGQVTVVTGTATVATNALAMATRFLLGPFGLLLGAISAAGIAYAVTRDNAKDYNKTLDTQKGLLEDVTKRVKMLSEFQRADVALDTQFKLNSNKKEQLKLEREIQAAAFDPNAIASLTIQKQQKLNELKEDEARLNAIMAAATANSNKTDGGSAEVSNKQLDALKQMQKEVGMTSDELFVFRQVQKSIANKDAPEVTAAIKKQAEEIVAAKKKAEEAKAAFQDLFGTDTVDTAALQQSKDYDTWLASISTTTTQMQALREEIEKTQAAMDAGDLNPDIGKEYIDGLNSQLSQLDTSPFDAITDSTREGLSSIQGMSAQGTKEYKKLGVAIQAVNAIQAVSAVLNQSNGDPYTAFARMAAMAASVASLGYSVGSLSGGFDDVAAERQQSQGLNVWGEKSESIANGIDIIANASEQLVGINTNMLKALTSVQNGISKASALIGRDAVIPSASVNVRENIFSGLQNFFSGDILDLTGKILGDTFSSLLNLPLNIIGGWLGGSSKVTDQGVRILGGQLGELIDDITVQSYQSVQYKKWRYGSTKNKTAYQDITDDVGLQFQLVLDSIADSVFAGGEMLGLNTQELEKAIQEFELDTLTISLKGLSVEEQQAEIEAVFGKVFDDLSGAVVPWLIDIQDAGESLGETLARAATQVNIMDLMVDQLGVTMFDKFSDQEKYAKAADEISDLVGGVDSLSEKLSGFIDSFASESVKLDIYSKSLTSALGEVGLTLPGTSQGFWELMESLDGTTESGREQIATLLNNQEAANQYYGMLEKITSGYRDAIDSMYDVTEAMAQMSLDSALAAARMGDFTLAEDLDLGSIAPDMANYSSQLEYDLARADTAAKLEELAKLTEGTISVDEKQLEALEQIKTAIEDSDGFGNDAAISELKAEMVTMNEVQKGQARNIADSNAILQQMLIDGIPVRIEQ